MIASRENVRQALKDIFGQEADQTTLDCWMHEVLKQDLSPVQLSILCLTHQELAREGKRPGGPAPDILEWERFVKAFVRTKEELVARLGRPTEALSELGEDGWFHSFQLSDGTLTRGGKQLAVLRSEFDAVFAPLDLRGQSVLDFGAWNGAFSVEAKRRGAGRVVATDLYTWAHPFYRGFERFLFVRKDFGLDIEYKVLDAYRVRSDTIGKFDIVLFLGVLYHLEDPISVITNLAEITTSWLVVETYLDPNKVPHPTMRYYPGAELVNDPTNWWGPNRQCVEDLLRTVGFGQIHFARHPTDTRRGIFHARRTDREEPPAIATGTREGTWRDTLGALIGRPYRWLIGPKNAHRPDEIITGLYRGLLEREADPAGLQSQAGQLRWGTSLERVVRGFIASPEFRARMLAALVPKVELPDLTREMPEHYETQSVQGRPLTIFTGRSDADIVEMEALIHRHHYYDRFNVWSPVVEIDKRIIATIVRALGASSCFELGCFTGPVLSLLADSGVSVAGADVSHLAFAFAYPNIRNSMIYGDLLRLDFTRRFDVVLCMDVLEHINPLKLDAYIAKILSILAEDGYVYMNSPMWGHDRVFGLVEEPYLEEWRKVGDTSYWRHWCCDDKGWPMHGHLIWASAGWWQRKFEAHGLVRDTAIEKAIHEHLAGFFETTGGRRSLFVLRRISSSKSGADVAAAVGAALAVLPGLPRAPRSDG